MGVTHIDVTVRNPADPTRIIFGDADAEPLLGVTALASVGVEVDPQSQRLKKLPAVRLKRAAHRPRPTTRQASDPADGFARSSSSTTARRNRAASAPVTAR